MAIPLNSGMNIGLCSIALILHSPISYQLCISYLSFVTRLITAYVQTKNVSAARLQTHVFEFKNYILICIHGFPAEIAALYATSQGSS